MTVRQGLRGLVPGHLVQADEPAAYVTQPSSLALSLASFHAFAKNSAAVMLSADRPCSQCRRGTAPMSLSRDGSRMRAA
jgi:hypothetical protein